MKDSTDTPSSAQIAGLLLEHAKDYAFLVLDVSGAILSWSAGAERIMGYASAEAVGRQFGFIFSPSDLAAGEDARELELAIREGRVEDTRWHIRKSGDRFWANGVTTAIRDQQPPVLLKIIRDETPARLAEENRILLLNELNHRINNTLTIVYSMVDQTLRANNVDTSIRESVSNRLLALASAHKTLVDQNWAGADLATIIARAVSPYEQQAKPRVRLDGAAVRLSPRQAVSLSLFVHELTTNAVKYGALKSEHGLVDVSWNIRLDGEGKRYLTLLWAERGGPTVAPPQRAGFGSRLVGRSFSDYGGEVRTDFRADGVQVSLVTPLDESGSEEMFDLSANKTAQL
jgi:PAS domain S-box-containing protein